MTTKVALEAEQHALVKQKAASLGISMAEYIRRLVDKDLADKGTNAGVSSIIGIGRSGGSDIAVEGQEAISDPSLAGVLCLGWSGGARWLGVSTTFWVFVGFGWFR